MNPDQNSPELDSIPSVHTFDDPQELYDPLCAQDIASVGETPHILHRLVFKNDHARLLALLELFPHPAQHPQTNSLCRGQTPLTLAIQLNHPECIDILIAHGASTLVVNAKGWSPFQEATSYGDRDVMRAVFVARRKELAKWFHMQGTRLLQQLSENLTDFYVEMHWQFQSWVPFVSRLCPSDTYKIYKRGTSVRIDTSLVGFERLSWVRGDISIIFIEEVDGPKLVICDHQRKLVQQLYPRDFSISENDIDEEISVALNTRINGQMDIDFSSLSVIRSQTGFWSFKIDRNEPIGNYPTAVWNIKSFDTTQQTRLEHLEAEPKPPMASLKSVDVFSLDNIKAIREKVSLENIRDTIRDQVREKGIRGSIFALSSKVMDVGGSLYQNARAAYIQHSNAVAAERERASSPKPPLTTSSPKRSRASTPLPEAGATPTEGVPFPDTASEESSSDAGSIMDESADARKAFNDLQSFRPTLDPPPPPSTTYSEYFDPSFVDTSFLHLGRPMILRQHQRKFRGTLWMYDVYAESAAIATAATTSSEQFDSTLSPSWSDAPNFTDPLNNYNPLPPIQSTDFPISIADMMPLLDLLGMSSNAHVRSLREFFNVQLPPGFPVQFEIPIGMLPISALTRVGNVKVGEDVARAFEDENVKTRESVKGWREAVAPVKLMGGEAAGTVVVEDGVDLFYVPGEKDGYRPGEVLGSEIEHAKEEQAAAAAAAVPSYDTFQKFLPVK
ncbi:GPCR-chaperone-domain-containing protein [Cladochytrium replicatum]|nr:GPCR-chaperone-domain-containing protein [Cladochytrium replicatum]